LDIIEKKMDKETNQASQGVTGLMIKEEKQEVLIGIIITHQGIQLGEHTVVQVHLLSESIREVWGR
jgi:hypothetical protein